MNTPLELAEELQTKAGALVAALKPEEKKPPPEEVPVLKVSADGKSIEWAAVPGATSYTFATIHDPSGKRETSYAEVKGTSVSPPAVPGQTVGYGCAVRTPPQTPQKWAKEVTITWPIAEETQAEREARERETKEREAKEHEKGKPPASLAVALNTAESSAMAKGCVDYVRLDDSVTTDITPYTSAGLQVIYLQHGPYSPHEGVRRINPSEFAGRLLAAYKAHPFWAGEITNEPAGSWFFGSGADQPPNPEAYAAICRACFEVFSSLAPRPLLLASYDGGKSGDHAWGDAVFRADPNMKNYVDGITLHPYGGHGSNSAQGNRGNVEAAHQQSGMDVYITELGWPTAVGQEPTGDSNQWTETQQAHNIYNFITWARTQSYIKLVTIFGTRDYGSNAYYGVLRKDGSKKPSYEALREAAHGLPLTV